MVVEAWMGASGFVLGGVIAAHLFFDLSLAMRSQLLKFLALQPAHLFFDLSLAMRSQLLKSLALQPPLPHLLASLRNGAALAFA